jgi:hypothetical protein
VHTGESHYVTASRRLARAALKRRANLPGIRVHSFVSLLDDKWLEYYHRKRVRREGETVENRS